MDASLACRWLSKLWIVERLPGTKRSIRAWKHAFSPLSLLAYVHLSNFKRLCASVSRVGLAPRSLCWRTWKFSSVGRNFLSSSHKRKFTVRIRSMLEILWLASSDRSIHPPLHALVKHCPRIIKTIILSYMVRGSVAGIGMRIRVETCHLMPFVFVEKSG